MVEIWAKSRKYGRSVSLSEHTAGLLKNLDQLSIILKHRIGNYEKLENLLEKSVVGHDLGKTVPPFQIATLGNRNYSPVCLFPDISHSIFSLFWINDSYLEGLSENEKKIVRSAVAFHHWRERFEDILTGRDRRFREGAAILLESPEITQEIERNLQEHFERNSDLKRFAGRIGFYREFAETAADGNPLFRYLTPPYLESFLPQRKDAEKETSDKEKKLRVAVSGLLMRLDHFTSFAEQERETGEDGDFSEEMVIEKAPPPCEQVRNNVYEAIKDKIPEGRTFDFWQEKIAERNRKKNLILVAPTGAGKTEFAALWGAGEKLFVTLPLRSAVNAGFERMRTFFGKENTGLLHSDADVYLHSNASTENSRLLDISRQLSVPVLVCTGDQIFPSALRYPGYEKIYATLAYSRLVIDEVQAYDPKAAAIVVKLIEDVFRLGGKFLLMTATLPSFIRNEIEKRTESPNIEDRYEGLENICRHRIRLQDKSILDEDVIREIADIAGDGKRVLVIANTVRAAQKIYEQLAGKADVVTLLHSRYTFYDRNQKESEILDKSPPDGSESGQDSDSGQLSLFQEKTENPPAQKPLAAPVNGSFANPKPEKEKTPKILITTQVAEASLDIDADYLFTELAPLDALVQRMGRVLRRARADAGKSLDCGPEANVRVCFGYEKKDEDKSNRFHLESGGGLVYENELLVLSLLLLNEAATKNGKPVQDFIAKYTKDKADKPKVLKETAEKIIGSGKKKGKKTSGDDSGIPEFTLSESGKKELVEVLYEKLPKDSSYKGNFYRMLSVLDAGLVSDRKAEAQRIFREILTVPVIYHNPDSPSKEFENSIERLCKKESLVFTDFKEEIVARFVFNLNIRNISPSDNQRAGILPDENTDIEKDKKNRLKRWLDDIYIVRRGEYTREKGYLPDKNTQGINIIF